MLDQVKESGAQAVKRELKRNGPMAEKPVKRYTIDGKPMTPDDLRRLHDYLVDI